MNAELLRVLGISVLVSSAAIALVLALRTAMRARFGARVAYATWALVPVVSLVALLPPPIVVKVLPPIAASTLMPVATNVSIEAAQAQFDPLPWLMGLWALGAGIALLGVLLQQRNFVRALGRLSVIDADLMRTDIVAAGVMDADVLRAESTSGCPALVGAIRPRIVLPADFEQRYDVRERELILIHERTHRARGDAQVNALAALLRCVFWFNPLVYFAASRFRFDQELACDAIVISRFPQARRRYADAMLKTQLAVLGLPVGCHWQSSHPLKERIAMLKHPLPGRARAAFGFGIAMLLIVGGSYAAWAAQPAVTAPARQNSAADSVGASITFTIDDGAPQTIVLLSPMNEPFALREGKQDNSWEWEGTVKPVAGGAFEFSTVLRHNGSVVSKPRLIVHEGEPAGIKAGDEDKDKAFRGFAAQITLMRGDTESSKSTSASKSTAASGAMESAPSERKAAYRALRPIAYPAGAIAAKIQGVVYVDVRIASDGSVTEAHVDHVDPAAAASTLAPAAVAGVRTWTFDPARKNGKNIGSSEIVPIGFALDPGNGTPRVSGTALEAIFISPQAPGVGTVDGPPSEDVSFRVMFPPHYPQRAVRAKQSAHMTFDVLVDEQGIPQSVAMAHSEPPEAAPMFTQASVEAIKKWHFNPAIKDGKPHAGHIEVPIDFVLKQDEG